MGRKKMFDTEIMNIKNELTKYGVKLIKIGDSYAIDKNDKRSVILVSILIDIAEVGQKINDCNKFLKDGKNGKFIMPLNNNNITKMKKIIEENEKELKIYLDELKQYEV